VAQESKLLLVFRRFGRKAYHNFFQIMMDCINFGTILYYMIGFAPQANYFFTFMGIVFVFNVLMSELLFVFATFAVTKAMVQVASACLVFLFMLFCGFIIAPNLIPDYYQWIYWLNPMAWAYRAVVVNEFRSSKYTEAESNIILTITGFTDRDGVPFGNEWILWGFVFMVGHILLTLLVSAIILSRTRVHAEAPPSTEAVERADEEVLEQETGNPEHESVNVPFTPITLTFEKVCYDVKSSTGDEDLRLLHEVYGYLKAGRMCALMGESGAGKTTLMDVIAMRKTSGTISGDIRVNGFPQDEKTFRRCSGYVEQFDIQSPELTVRETVLFSTRLRLDGTKVQTDDDKQKFCDMVLRILELTPLADSLVGNADQGGLSFEQKKRLSIAVELAASPSILFLDEVS
jgi:ABC-type lipoprotein export system ATPase subunit